MTKAKTILVVDDDETLRTGVKLLLQKHGYQTLEAEDGTEAREIIDAQHPDLVILDMMMPRWGGFAVLEHYQAQPAAPAFIMVSGNEGSKYKAYAVQTGAVDYLCKPFPMERLLQRIEHHFGSIAPSEAAPEQQAMDWFRILCPRCGARIKVPVQLLGQRRSCPGCGTRLAIERQPPGDQGPKLVLEM